MIVDEFARVAFGGGISQTDRPLTLQYQFFPTKVYFVAAVRGDVGSVGALVGNYKFATPQLATRMFSRGQ